MAPRGKIVRSTSAQIKLLVDYMSTNPVLASGQINGPLGAQELENEWLQLQQLLAEAGPAKTVSQWKHTWRDLKKKARDDAERARMAQNCTGNGVPIPEISDNSLKILGTIKQECGGGIGVECETQISEISGVVLEVNDEPIPLPVIEVHPPVCHVRPITPRAPARERRRAAPRCRPADVRRCLEAVNTSNNILRELVAEMRVSNLMARRRKTRPSPCTFLKF